MEHPVILAPMAFAAGGKLAAAVTASGGLGLIGGGYGDARWPRHRPTSNNNRIKGGFQDQPQSGRLAMFCIGND